MASPFTVSKIEHFSDLDEIKLDDEVTTVSLQDVFDYDTIEPLNLKVIPSIVVIMMVKVALRRIRQPKDRFRVFCLIPRQILRQIDPFEELLKKLRNLAYTSQRQKSRCARWSYDQVLAEGIKECVGATALPRRLEAAGWPLEVVTNIANKLQDMVPDRSSRASDPFPGITKLETELKTLRETLKYGSESRTNFQDRKLIEKMLSYDTMPKQRLNDLVVRKGVREAMFEFHEPSAFMEDIMSLFSHHARPPSHTLSDQIFGNSLH
jgi:hypothetical protein